MKVNLARTFPMPASAERAWELLQDIERVAACMPGARITERTDDRHYKGTVAVRFGPASLSFRGEVDIVAIEPASRTLRLVGKGTDTTGGSGASMDLTARVDALDETSCSLVGKSEVSMSGKVAAFGGRVADAVAEQVLKLFAANFAAELQARQVSAGSAEPVAPEEVAPAGEEVATARTVERGSTQLSGPALLWGVIVRWLRSLFGLRGT